MEKILYPVWKPAAVDGDAFRELLLQDLAPELIGLGVRGLRISVVDSDVAAAAGLRQENSRPVMDAMLSVWLDSAVFRQAVEQHRALPARGDGGPKHVVEPAGGNDKIFTKGGIPTVERAGARKFLRQLVQHTLKVPLGVSRRDGVVQRLGLLVEAEPVTLEHSCVGDE